MAWRIFLHSVRQVFGNLDGALRVSAVLTLVQAVLALTLGRSLPADQAAMEQMLQDGTFPTGQFLGVLLVMILAWLWIVVSWHRYILLNEQPSLVPVLRVDRMLGYFGKSLLIGLMLLPLAFILGLLIGAAVFPLMQSGLHPGVILLAMVLVVYLPVGTVGMRLSAVLPGVALQPGVPLMTGWDATRGATTTILGVVVLSVAGTLALNQLVQTLFPDPAGLAAILASVVVNWVTAMVGASILTTLYGHYVEKRPLV